MLAGLLAGISLACLPTAAHAALISTDACDNATLTQPFAQYGDSNLYKAMPGGDFEGSTAGWTLTGGAHVVSGGADGSAHSLYLPAGASATTPLTCVDAAYPTARYSAKVDGLLSTIVVSLVYKGSVVGIVPIPGDLSLLNYSWRPSAPMQTLAIVPGLLDGGTSQLQLRFTSLLGPSQVDNVFIDPRMFR